MNKTSKCRGKILARKNSRDIVDCSHCGFIHVLPMYLEDELEAYYKEHYSDSTPSHIFRLKVYHVNNWLRPGRVLDLGCWKGTQLKYFKDTGWECCGLELNRKAALEAKRHGYEIYQISIRDFFSRHADHQWQVINVAYILEHIPRPDEFLMKIRRNLSDDGILIVEVPNEFNPFQLSYLNREKCDPYWIALPDHLNYFNRRGIQKLLKKTGWKTIHAESSFPMEMFLLMGDDYLKKPEQGPVCFQKAVKMEQAVMEYDIKLLSDFYSLLYKKGIGRSLVYYLRKSDV